MTYVISSRNSSGFHLRSNLRSNYLHFTGKLAEFLNGQDCDCHLVAGLLKSWLRQLPDCLLTTEHYTELISSVGTLEHCDSVTLVENPSKGPNIAKIKATLKLIPAINYALTKELFKLYVAVKDNKEFNSMGADNVATTNAPNLINPKIDNLDVMDSLMKGNQVVKAMIEHYEEVFGDDIPNKLFDEVS